MNEKRIYKSYYRKDLFRILFNKGMNIFHLKKKRINPKYEKSFKWLNLEEAQRAIEKYIIEDKPVLISRFGGNEAHCTAEAIGIELGGKKSFFKEDHVTDTL